MSKSTRHWTRRKLDMICGNLKVSFEHLQEIADIYETPEPLIFKALKSYQDLIIMTAKEIESLKINV